MLISFGSAKGVRESGGKINAPLLPCGADHLAALGAPA